MLKVLYVDDEAELLEIGRIFLERSPEFRVETRTSAREALASMETLAYDAIVSDYQMPGMDGIEFLKAVRERYGDIPFILFTGKGREEVVIAAINNGADFYLQKGGAPDAQFAELAHKIRKAVERRQALEALKDSEQRLADIINFLPDATFAIDRSGRVIAWNRAIEELTGVVAASMMGKGDYEYALPFYGERRPILIDLIFESDKEIAGKYAHIVHQNGVLIADTTLPRPKGNPATLMGKASPLYDRHGAIMGAIESIRDLTDRKLAEEALRESEEKYRLVVENSHDAIYIYRGDNLLFANTRSEELTGYSRDELMAMSVWDLVHPDDRARLQESGRRRITGEPIPPVFTARLVTKSGEIKYGEFYVERVTYQDQPALLGIVRDITERKKAEEALSASEEKYRTVFETTGTAMVVIEDDETISLVNSEFIRLSGYSREEIENRMKWTAFVVPEDHDRMLKQHRLRRNNREPALRHYEFRYITRSGDVRDTDLTIDLIPGTKKSVASLIDITERKRAEAGLIAAGKEFAGLLDQIQDAYYRSDMQGRLIRVSRSVAHLLGFDDTSQILGRNIAEEFYFNPADRKALIDLIRRDGKITNYEVQLKRKDGTPVLVSTSSHYFFGPDGVPLGIEGTFRDITEIKKAEESLRTSEERFRTLVETSPDIIWELDAAGIFRYSSPQVKTILGYDPAEILGKTVTDIIPEKSREYVLSLMTENIRMSGQMLTVEIPVIHRDGRELVIEARSRAVFDAGGAFTGLRGIAHDITERKRAEESKELYRKLVATVPDTVIRTELDGTITFVNDNALELGGFSTADEIVGKSVLSILASSEHQKAIENLRLMFDRNLGPVDYQVTRKDGTEIILEVNGAVLRTGEGTPYGMVFVCRDTTARRKAEETIRKVNRQLTLLSGITRHDILNNVAITLGYLELAKEKSCTGVDPFLEKIERNINQIRARIEFTRVYEDLGTKDPQWQDIHEVLSRLDLPRGISVTDTCAGTEIYADVMLGSVFFALVDNSARHGGHVKEIRISAIEDPEGLRIVYEDDGTGIPAGEKERIFERGYGRNTGLGLFLAREILSLTGISIQEAGVQGTGARFEIRAPIGVYRFSGTR